MAQRTAQALTAGNKPEQDESLRDACIRQLDAENQVAAAHSALAHLEASIEENQDETAKRGGARRDPHARWGILHAQLYWLLNHDLTGDFDPESAYPRHLDRMIPTPAD